MDRWLTFLWRVDALDKTDDMVVLAFNAFDASARAIEGCRLNMDLPDPVEQVSERMVPIFALTERDSRAPEGGRLEERATGRRGIRWRRLASTNRAG